MFTISGSQRVVPLCQSVVRDAKENREKKMARQNPGGEERASRPQDYVRPFFPHWKDLAKERQLGV